MVRNKNDRTMDSRAATFRSWLFTSAGYSDITLPRMTEPDALAVLAAVTIGLYMFGIVGGIIAIPIAGSIRVLAEEYFANAEKRRKASVKNGDDDDDAAEIEFIEKISSTKSSK